jgi:hypothetical protein
MGWTGICFISGTLGKILNWTLFGIRLIVLGSLIFNFKKQDIGSDEFQPNLNEKD